MENQDLIRKALASLGNYVNKDGLLYFKTKIDGIFAKKTEVYTQEQINTKLDGKVDKVSGKGLSTNDYTTTEKNKLAGIDTSLYALKTEIPNNVSELTNDSKYQTDAQVESTITSKGYQTSTQVNSAITSKGYQTAVQVQNAINSALSGITGIDFQIVQTLPTTGVKGTIYLKPISGNGESNGYEEYIWIPDLNKYELIGSTNIDLTNYYNTSNFLPVTNGDIDGLFS